ncbi:hypothetical protein NA56DRAFT_664190 [Hyaloscypha hepaticicola]|uniref:F-box domain-containing protein n=1 Tax=Hyaloscypha hepaticicola TaxID=2082293 RepID=A0A2J6PMD6_9HELO|nr:hypothetical protein NA56DRAFT_664190 [Hyaloscypha hepaticicola]
MNNPAPSGILSSGDIDTMSALKSVTYVLNDLSFLDKLSKKGRAEVFKNLRQISTAEKATADGTVKSLPRTTNLSYIVNDISFLDKLAKKGQAAVLKNLRQTPPPGFQNDAGLQVSPPTPARCYFLDVIPIEVRNLIYELLLVNPILEEASSISRKSTFGESAKYGLIPAILRTCRQIESEASKALYSKKTYSSSPFVPALSSPHGTTRRGRNIFLP